MGRVKCGTGSGIHSLFTKFEQSLLHLWLFTYFGFLTRSEEMKSLACCEMGSKCLGLNSYLTSVMLRHVSSTVSPWNGETPLNLQANTNHCQIWNKRYKSTYRIQHVINTEFPFTVDRRKVSWRRIRDAMIHKMEFRFKRAKDLRERISFHNLGKQFCFGFELWFKESELTMIGKELRWYLHDVRNDSYTPVIKERNKLRK